MHSGHVDARHRHGHKDLRLCSMRLRLPPGDAAAGRDERSLGCLGEQPQQQRQAARRCVATPAGRQAVGVQHERCWLGAQRQGQRHQQANLQVLHVNDLIGRRLHTLNAQHTGVRQPAGLQAHDGTDCAMDENRFTLTLALGGACCSLFADSGMASKAASISAPANAATAAASLAAMNSETACATSAGTASAGALATCNSQGFVRFSARTVLCPRSLRPPFLVSLLVALVLVSGYKMYLGQRLLGQQLVERQLRVTKHADEVVCQCVQLHPLVGSVALPGRLHHLSDDEAVSGHCAWCDTV